MMAVEVDASAAEDDLLRQIETLTASLEARIAGKLQDAALQSEARGGEELMTPAAAPSLEDAAVRDFGVKARAHEMVALKSRVSAFYARAGKGFRKTARGRASIAKAPSHPRSFLPQAEGKMPSGFKAALLAALTQE